MTPNTTGNILSIDIDMDNPKIKLGPIQFNHLSLFTGKNDTGKTFLLKCTWFMSMLAQNCVIARKSGAAFNIAQSARWMWERTFEESDKMSGKVAITFENGGTVGVEFKLGLLVNQNIHLPDTITEPAKAVFMSKNMRTFDAMHLYLKLRATTGKTTLESIIEEMCKHFKLYDVLAVEGLIQRMPLAVDTSMQARIHNFDDQLHLSGFNVDLTNCYFYSINSTGDMRNMSTYGAGHQSLLNMIIMNS